MFIYRHSDDMINRLERAGLGYHVNSDETDDKLGKLKKALLYDFMHLDFHLLILITCWAYNKQENFTLVIDSLETSLSKQTKWLVNIQIGTLFV